MTVILAGRKTIIYSAMALAIAVFVFGVYEYFRPASNRSMEVSVRAISAQELHRRFAGGDSVKCSEWLNQIIEITGKVQSVEGATVLLDPGVVCTLEEASGRPEWLDESEVTLKGRVLGFDDLFNEVRMDFCVPVLNP